MAPQSVTARWKALQADAHLAEAQEVIRQAIVQGTIRVVPGPGEGIRIIPSAPGTSRTLADYFEATAIR